MTEQLPGFPPQSWESQGQRLDGPALSDEYIRHACMDIAEHCDGMTNTEAVFYDACYPWDIEIYRKQMAIGQDKCALVCLMILRGCGFALPDDDRGVSWRFGHCPPGKKPPLDPMSQLRMLVGYKAGNELALPGCMNIIMRPGEDLSTHAITILKSDGKTVTSIDGGKQTAVSKKTRDIIRLGNDLCLHDSIMGARKIIGTIDPAAMRAYIVRDYYLPIRGN